MSEENSSVSQNEENPEVEIERDAETEALYEAFDLKPQVEKKEESVDEPPAIEETKTETKKVTVKFNKEDVEIDEDKVPELLQKGLALDKERERSKQSQLELDRAAKLLGFKDNAELTANLDKLEQQHQQKEQDAYNLLKQDLREQAEDAGLDADKVEAWLNNHPLIKEAQQTKDDRDREQIEKQIKQTQEENNAKWQIMYKDPRVLAAFPTIEADSMAFSRGEVPAFFNAEMKARFDRGYDPLDAMLLAHSDKFQGQTKKIAEQKAIKQQQLGSRAQQVQGNSADLPDEPTLLPAQIALAAEFGVSTKGVMQQQKLLNSRR